MAYSVTFAGLTAPVMSQLDTVFTQTGNLGIIPGVVTGTNDLTFTPTAGRTPNITAYFDGLQIAAVVVTTNTGPMTARVAALAALNVYKDSPAGPVALTGGEAISTCMIGLRYNSALNAGAGGWHIISNTGYAGGTINNANIIMTGTSSIAAPNANINTLTASIATAASLTATLSTLVSLNVASLASITKLLVGASASSITRILSAAGTLAFTVVPANSTQQQNIAVPGAQVNDVVQVGPPASVTTGTHFTGYVPAAGTVGVICANPTAASLVPVAGIYRVAVTGFT